MNWVKDQICRVLLLAAAQLFVLLHIACGASSSASRDVQAEYDATTGKLRQLTMDAKKDGKPNVISYMDGARFVRIEIDSDENGSVDRWEYYSPDQNLEKVGLSRLNDGIADTWLFKGPDGQPARIDRATRRDGKVNRSEFYTAGQLTRAEEDTNGDGRLDKWETYQDGALAEVSFDPTNSGKPTITINYREEKP
jgi:hypothetical protein